MSLAKAEILRKAHITLFQLGARGRDEARPENARVQVLEIRLLGKHNDPGFSGFESSRCAIEIDEAHRESPPGLLLIFGRDSAPSDLVHAPISEVVRLALVARGKVNVYDGRRVHDVLGKHQDNVLILDLPAIEPVDEGKKFACGGRVGFINIPPPGPRGRVIAPFRLIEKCPVFLKLCHELAAGRWSIGKQVARIIEIGVVFAVLFRDFCQAFQGKPGASILDRVSHHGAPRDLCPHHGVGASIDQAAILVHLGQIPIEDPSGTDGTKFRIRERLFRIWCGRDLGRDDQAGIPEQP